MACELFVTIYLQKQTEWYTLSITFAPICIGVKGKRFDFGDHRYDNDEQMVSMKTETYPSMEEGKSSLTSESDSSWKGTSE